MAPTEPANNLIFSNFFLFTYKLTTSYPEEYKPNLDLLNTYIKNIKTFITENKTSKFIFDKDWEILINNIWMN